jgi:hypothetical protein
MKMTNVIMDTGKVAELLGADEGDDFSSMEARKEPTGDGIEFHVAMTSWTMHDMQDLIVQAAAAQIVGRIGKEPLAKMIEAKCIELVSQKCNETLSKVTSEIIDQPIIPVGYGTKEPVTMRQFIGLTGREFLSEKVDYNGAPAKDSWAARDSKSRVQYLVEQNMNAAFQKEIKAATSAAIMEVRAAVEAQHKAFLEAEKARFREALEKVTA